MTKVTRLPVDDGTASRARRAPLPPVEGLTSLETVGQQLRAARLERGDDLATVSRALKIRKDHLDAIEEDRLDALPGRTYAIGFVRAYAEYLGFNAKEMTERYKAEIAGRSEPEAVTVTLIDDEDHRPLPRGWKIAAGVVVALMLYGLYYVVSSTSSAPPATPPPPALNPKPVAHSAPTHPAQSAPNGLSQAAASTEADPLPPGLPYGLAHRDARVVLRVHQPTRITVEGLDGKLFINRELQRGDSYRVPNVPGATLSTPNPNAIEVDLDGQSTGYASRDATPATRLSLDPTAIMDRVKGAVPR